MMTGKGALENRGVPRAIARFAQLAIGIVVVMFAIGVLVGPARAEAVAPDVYGWWTQTDPQGAVPSALGATGNPIEVPPDVPSNGMEVEGPESNQVAVAAVAYSVPEGYIPESLALTVAPNSATGPGSALEVCQLNQPEFTAEQGGPMSDAPAWNCSHSVSGSLDPTGKSWTFPVSSFLREGHVAVAIIPAGETTRVVFSQPTASSLAVRSEIQNVSEPVNAPAPSEANPSDLSSGDQLSSSSVAAPSVASPIVAPSLGPLLPGVIGQPVNAVQQAGNEQPATVTMRPQTATTRGLLDNGAAVGAFVVLALALGLWLQRSASFTGSHSHIVDGFGRESIACQGAGQIAETPEVSDRRNT